MIETTIGGGVTSVFDHRRITASNSLIRNHDRAEESSSSFCVTANNLDSHTAIAENKHPGRCVQRAIPIQEILDTTDYASIGYFVEEFDLSYQPSLHDKHRDFPLTPIKDVDEDEWLGDYQIKLKEQHNLPSSK